MQDRIRERVVLVAIYTIRHKSTVRDTAKIFKVSKSTIYTDLTKRLKKISPQMASSAREVLDYNYKERAYRGGHALKMKYKSMKEKSVV